MNMYKLQHLSVSSIVLTSFLMASPSLQASNLIEEENEKNLKPQQIIPKKNDELALSLIENKIGGVLAKFENIEKNVEESLQKQTFVLGQTFLEKVQVEEDKKKFLIEETERGIGEKSKNFVSIKQKIKEQTGFVSTEIKNISSFLDDKTGKEISGALKNRVGKEISKGINGFSNNLGNPSDYHNKVQYKVPNPIGYQVSPDIDDLKSSCSKIDDLKYKIGLKVTGCVEGKGTVEEINICNYADAIYNIASKFWSSDNGIMEKAACLKQLANDLVDPINVLGHEAIELRSRLQNYENEANQRINSNKTVLQEASWTSAKDYGEFLVKSVLEKGKKEEESLQKNVSNNVDKSLDDYFAQGKEFSDKMQSLKRNTDKIEGHIKSIETFSNDIDTVSEEVVNFTKNQAEKIGLHHDSLIGKGKEFDQEARTIIEKNREVSLGVMKGKTSEMFMAAKSLALMLNDKYDQVESYKEQIKDTGETFKHHEGILVNQHDKHLVDVKGGKKEVLEEKDKLLFEKQSTIQKLENKTIQLENDLKKTQEETNTLNLKIAKFSGESQLIDGTLKGMLMMMGVNMLELNDLSGPMLAQKCFAKYLETKK